MKKQKALLSTEKAWLAGFIDGEGYIGITFQRKRETRSQAPSPRYHPYRIIANTNRAVLEWIVERTEDGRVHSELWKQGHRPSYQYHLTKRDQLHNILIDPLPYLHVKKEQGRLILFFLERRKAIKPLVGRGRRGITSFDQKDEEFYHKLLSLNKRGF